jgi:anti-sigma regulatory factor (Ser/Thr protein kinase)
MGQLRNAFRAYALVEDSPSEVLARLNRLTLRGGDDTIATVLLLMLDRETGEITYTSAGHPPPLVLGRDGPRFLEGGRSVPVGATDAALFRQGSAVLEAGDALLLYTDGLVERRDSPLDHGLERLAEVAATGTLGLEELCDRVLGGLLGTGERADDVALIAVRAEPAALQHVSLRLPAEPGALIGLRRRMARFLHAAGASDTEAYEITLAISEACGNAIEHAYGPGDASFELEVELDGDELVASVRDTGSWREHPGPTHRGRGLKIIEGIMDSFEVDQADDGTVVRMRRRLEAGVPA